MNSNVAAERAVLGGVYSGGYDTYIDISSFVNPNSFTLEENTIWYTCLSKYYESVENRNKKPDVATLNSIAFSLGFSEQANNKRAQDILRAISNYPVNSNNVLENAKIIQRLYYTRMLRSEIEALSTELSAVTGQEPMVEILAKAESTILDFSEKYGNDGGGAKRIGENAEDYIDFLINNGKPQGIPTGFKWYDEAIGGGLCPNSVDFVAARAKGGKSLFSNAVGLNIAKLGVPILYVDTEMSYEEQVRRLVSSLSMVKERRIKDGLIRGNQEEIQKVKDSAALLKSLPYYHRYVAGFTTDEIMAMIRRWFIQEVGLDESGYVKPCVVIYDYIKMLDASDGGNKKEYENLGFLMQSLKNLIGKYNARCLCLGQLNRDGLDHEDERAIAGSDRLTWFSTSTSLIKWLKPEELAIQTNQNITHKIIPLLSRHGGKWRSGDYICVSSVLECCKMTEGPASHELPREFVSAIKPKKGKQNDSVF